MMTSSQNKNISGWRVLALVYSPILPTDFWVIEVLQHNSHIKQKLEKKMQWPNPSSQRGTLKKKKTKTEKEPVTHHLFSALCLN